MSLIEIHALKKNYGNFQALKGLDLSFEAGRIVGLLGPNGSGKTTLLRILSAYDMNYQGEVLIDGQAPGLHSRAITSSLPDKANLSLILQAVVILSLLFRMKLAESGFSLFFSRIRAVLSTIFIPRNTGLFLLNILLGLLVMHALIAMSISVGSMGCFKKLKQGGPFLVFFISQLAVDQIGKWIMRSLNFSSLYDKDFSLAWGDFAQGQIQSGNLSEGIYVVLIDALPMTLFWAFITVIAWAITIYITDRKISLA